MASKPGQPRRGRTPAVAPAVARAPRPRRARGGTPQAVAAAGAEARERILATAEEKFAEAGFHGASIRTLAQALGMAGATVMHHFPTKEKLYAAVLGRIAEDLGARLEAALGAPAPTTPAGDRARLQRLCEALVDWTAAHPDRSRLLVRELLDNPVRVRRARRLHLAPVVHRLARFLAEAQARRSFAAFHPLVVLYHLVGSVSYFHAALPTMARINPDLSPAELAARYRAELPRLMEAALLPRS